MKTSNSSTGIGFSGLLTLVFIVLKLIGKISWKWIWVLSPIWITFVFVLIVATVWEIVKWRALKRGNN